MTTPPIVANTDFQQWQSWQPVKTPAGDATYYVVPGYGGQYVFDPFKSSATGKITLYENPKPAYDAAAQAQKQQEEAVGTDAQLAQIGGVVTGAGTTYLVGDAIGAETFGQSTLGGWLGAGPEAGAQVAQQVATPVAQQVAGQGVSSAAANAAGQSFYGGLGVEPSSVMSVQPEAVGAFDLGGIGSAGNAYLPAIGAIGAADVLLNDRGPARGAIQGGLSGAAIGSYFGPPGAIVGGVAGGTIGLAKGLLGGHVTTGEQQAKNWNRIADKVEGTPTSDYVAQYQKHIDDPNNPAFWAPDHQAQWEAAGRPDPGEWRKENMMAKFEDMTAKDLVPGVGFFETFGSQWLEGFTEDQRIEVAKRAKDAGLVRSSRGDILIDDKTQLKALGESVLKGEETPREEPKEITVEPVVGANIVATPQERGGDARFQPGYTGPQTLEARFVPSQVPNDISKMSTEEIKKLFQDMVNNQVVKGVGAQPSVFS